MKVKKMKKEKMRLQFDFSKNAVERLDDLVEITDSASRAEVLRNALRVYEYLIDKKTEGYDLELVGVGKQEKIRPALKAYGSPLL